MMANLSYLDFHGLGDERGWTLADAKRLELVQDTDVANFEGRKQQFLAMADTVRFGDIRMHHFISLTDEDEELQFSATCYDLPDGTLCIAFRGTDGTLVGWREDFNMSWQSVVPAQEAAVYYLEKAAELDDRPLCLVGHSKGGNLAAYAAACSRPEVQDRLKAVYSFDGPGMSPDIFQSEGYQRVVDRIHSFVPQTAIVGMMMEYHRKYTVVKSDASGIAQHDPLTWQVYGPRFETVEKKVALRPDGEHQGGQPFGNEGRRAENPDRGGPGNAGSDAGCPEGTDAAGGALPVPGLRKPGGPVPSGAAARRGEAGSGSRRSGRKRGRGGGK